ncbi:MAG TPA: hypothetical protein VK171_08205 [Fimbriimonas sp.]|nr:hypothetical protein [Fimbriimonas sp.]
MKNLAVAIIFSSILALGCTGGDANAPVTGETPSTGGQPVASTSKCQLCSKEVAKGELVDLHGQMVCKDCQAAHKH